MSEIPLTVFIRKEPKYHPRRDNLVLSVEEAMKKLNEDRLILTVSKNYWNIIDSKFGGEQICEGKFGENKTVFLSDRDAFYCIGVYDPTNNKHLQNMVNLVEYRVGTADNSTLLAESVLDG